jgi:c(7)-type cytochrome triheme protein
MCKQVFGRAVFAASLWLIIALPVGTALAQTQGPERWKRLAEDRIHDPASPAIGVLQEPGEALSILPSDVVGNKVRWVPALREGYIAPRAKMLEDTEVNILDSNVLMMDTGEMPVVLFPHEPHTEWLDCSNCHEAIFKSKVGATPVNMFQILQGRYCGRCHGAVAFPLTECNRCHSVPRSKVKRR